MHFLENSMFVLNAYFCRELRFVAILRSKLRFLLRNTGVDSDFTQNFWGKNWRLGALVLTPALPRSIAILIRDFARATLNDSRRMKWFWLDFSTHRLSTACYLDDSFPILKRFFEWATHYTLFTMKAPILPEVQAQDFSPSSSGRFPWCWL